MKKSPRLFIALALGTAFCGVALGADASSTPSLQQRRVEILQAGSKGAAALPLLRDALQSDNPLLRRAAARALGQVGAAAQPLLETAVKSDADALTRRTAVQSLARLGTAAQAPLQDVLQNDADALTRRAALLALLGLAGNDAVPVLKPALQDSDELVRAAAVQTLTQMKPYSDEVTALLKTAQRDQAPEVSRIAAQALWPFHQPGISFQQLTENQDHQMVVAQTIPLPTEGWKFQLDPRQDGHESHWYQTDFDDSKWSDIKIGEAWESQIGKNYDGVAWYRLSFTLPEKPAMSGADMVFDGVDESAWIWINGEYIGDHDIGLSGWDKRFAINATDQLKWNAKNQITVRVLDRKQAGGIWKAAHLEVFK